MLEYKQRGEGVYTNINIIQRGFIYLSTKRKERVDGIRVLYGLDVRAAGDGGRAKVPGGLLFRKIAGTVENSSRR